MFVIENESKMFDSSSGIRGTAYESRICMLFALRGYTRGLKNFRLRYQVPALNAGKFDDVVFDEGGGNQLVFQLKHREEKQTRISSSQLFNETFNADYNLLKYVKSVIDLNTKNTLKREKRMAVVFTNTGFDLQKDSNELSLTSNGKDRYKEVTDIQLHPFTTDENSIFDTSNSFSDAKYYKFDNDPNVVQILKRQAKTFSKNWRNNSIKYDETLAKLLDDLTEEDIREALKDIVFAVGQPNVTDLETLIKNEMKDSFKLQDADTVYQVLENEMTRWCNMKKPFDDQSSSPNPHEIQFKDLDLLFQKYIKKVSFGSFVSTVPTTVPFTGRLAELDLIKKKLEKNPDLIVSQSTKKNDLGGIGKTELVKQFIKKYGQFDFYGRVIWIEAESDESVKKSFRGLAEKLDIQDRENKNIKTIIDQIFDFFHGVKVLFVFDNVDNNANDTVKYSDDKEKFLVNYCRKIASDPTRKHRPYFLFTSRNLECFPGMPSLNLSVLSAEDANELIKKGLIAQNYTNQDVEELAEKLQNFPLALQQALAYINRKHEIESVTGGTYVIQNYLTEFAKRTEETLNYPHTNDFGEFGQTTFRTWNITFDAMSEDNTNNPNAIKVLQLISYLYADKIDSEMFLPLFENDSKRNEEAFLLLEKYSIITKTEESTFYQIHRLVQRVIQLKFKEQEQDILKQAWKLIFPKLYVNYFDENEVLYIISQLIDECTIDQVLHYNSLESYIKNYRELNTDYQDFLRRLNGRVLSKVSLKDDIDKVMELPLSQEEFRDFAERKYKDLIKSHSNKVLKYFIEKAYLDFKNADSIMLNTISYRNLDLFKYMIEKGASLKGIVLVPTDLIDDIIQGNFISLKSKLESHIKDKETKENDIILKKSLFFATLFNQESIVKFLIKNKISPDFIFCQQERDQMRLIFGPIENNKMFYGPITAAATLKSPHIFKILLKHFDKPESKDKITKIINDLLDEKYFSDKDCFEIGLKRYLTFDCGNINDKNDYKCEWESTFLCYVTSSCRFFVNKIEIANILLENGGDPCLMNAEGDNALFNVLIKINDSLYYLCDTDDKNRFCDIYREMRKKISTEKLMSSIIKCLYKKIQFNIDVKMSDFVFSEKNGSNFRNEKGETLLIYFICELRKFDDDESEYSDKRTGTHKRIVEFLCDEGLDVNKIDHDGNNALHYTIDLEDHFIFMYLLSRGSEVLEQTFEHAIKYDKLQIVQAIISAEHFKEDHLFSSGLTAINLATNFKAEKV